MAATRARAVVVAAALALAPAAAQADDEATGGVTVYADDDETTIVSPRARVTADLGERVSATASYDADVITTASVDVRTGATPRGFTDIRHGGTVGGTVALDRRTKVGATLRGSTENDFDLLGATATLSHELRDRTWTLTGAYGLERSWIGRSNDETFAEDAWSQRASAAATVVLDARTVLSASYSLGVATGFLASPYRFVPLWSSLDAQGRPAASVPERLPSVRDRHALGVELRRALPDDWFLGGRLTAYLDGWGIGAGTLNLEATRAFAHDALTLRVRGRGYAQSAARFHRERYATWPEVPDVVSGDRELGAMTSVMVGLGAHLRLTPVGPAGLWAHVGADAMWFHYFDFAPLEDRDAILLSAGLEGRL